MNMEPRRKLLFALIASAMVLNIGYGLVNNGVRLPLLDDHNTNNSNDLLEGSFEVDNLREGSSFTSIYNMTVDVDMGTEKGSFLQEGTIIRTISQRSLTKSLSGSYSLLHSRNDTQDLSFQGEMSNTRKTNMDDIGLPSVEEVSSQVSFSRPKGFGSSSDIESRVEQFMGLRMDLIWKALIPTDGRFNTSSKGNVSIPVDLREAGINREEITLNWEVTSIEDELEGRILYIQGRSEISEPGSVVLELSFQEGSSWPISTILQLSGQFWTDDGLAQVEVIMIDELLSWSMGTGEVLPFMIYYPYGPSPPTSSSGSLLLPREGSETKFRSVLEEALQTCLEQGSNLKEYVNRNGWEGLSLIEADYYRMDGVEPSWVWNITLSTDQVDGISKTLQFEVGVEGGLLVDQRRFYLIGESTGSSPIHPDPTREMITLEENEKVIEDTDLSDQFFRGDGYSNSYSLDIIRRGTACCDIGSVLFMNMLGVERAHVQDLFISSSVDRKDPSMMYLAVVDGSSGSLISTTVIEGATVPLFNAYGFDLA